MRLLSIFLAVGLLLVAGYWGLAARMPGIQTHSVSVFVSRPAVAVDTWLARQSHWPLATGAERLACQFVRAPSQDSTLTFRSRTEFGADTLFLTQDRAPGGITLTLTRELSSDAVSSRYWFAQANARYAAETRTLADALKVRLEGLSSVDYAGETLVLDAPPAGRWLYKTVTATGDVDDVRRAFDEQIRLARLQLRRAGAAQSWPMVGSVRNTSSAVDWEVQAGLWAPAGAIPPAGWQLAFDSEREPDTFVKGRYVGPRFESAGLHGRMQAWLRAHGYSVNEPFLDWMIEANWPVGDDVVDVYVQLVRDSSQVSVCGAEQSLAGP